MKNIFTLTKTERCGVIFIVTALLAVVAVRVYRQRIINPPPSPPTSAVTKPMVPHPEEENGAADERP